MVKKKGLTVADFFCGAGGFSEGFLQKGFNVNFAIDNWAPAKETYDLNHPDCKCTLMDIHKLNTPECIDRIVPDTEVIIGSPSCVSFSNSNNSGKADKSPGIKLIKTFLGIVAWKLKKGKLKYWIMENVPNSKKYVKDEYTWEELGLPGGNKIALKIPVKELLNAANYGAPQVRKRFICGNYPIPKKTHPKEDWISIKKVLNVLSNPLEAKKVKEIADPIYGFKILRDDLSDHFYDSRVEKFEWESAKRLKEDHGFMGKMSFPEDITKPSRTVMATMSASTRESIILNADKEGRRIGYRIPTIREIASFMSFPITYQFAGKGRSTKYKLVGNAVCCKLSSALAEEIAKKEGIKTTKFKPKRIIFPKINLNGSKKIIKKIKPKRDVAKFAIHIPNMKIKGFRVELTNKNSKFPNKVLWESFLHYGTGKNALKSKISQMQLEKYLATKIDNLNQIKKDMKKTFKKFDKMKHKKLQENFVVNDVSNILTPTNALILMDNLIKRNIKKSETSSIKISNGTFRGKEIPLKILLGLYFCNNFVEYLI